MPFPPRCSPSPPGSSLSAELLDVEAVAGLGDLGGTVEGVAVEAAEDRAVAVARGGAAPAADLGLDDREVAAGVGVRSADERAADRGEVARGQPVAEVRREAAQDQCRRCGPRPRSRSRTPPAGLRRRPIRDGSAPSAAGSGRAFAEACAPVMFMKTICAAIIVAVTRGVVRARVLVGVVAEVDDELVVGDLDASTL